MFRKVLINIIFLFLLTNIFPNNKTSFDLFNQANNLFTQNKYNDAIEIYENLYKDGYKNFNILYNIGYSYYKLDNKGLALYYLEKAFFYSPFNNKVNELLKIVNSNNADESRYLDKIILFLNPNLVFYLIILSILFFSILSIIYFKFKHRKIFYIYFINFLLIVLLSLISFIQFTRFNQSYGVIISANESTPLLLSPYIDTVIYKINDNIKVNIKKQENNFIEIKLNDSLTGWISKDQIKIINYY